MLGWFLIFITNLIPLYLWIQQYFHYNREHLSGKIGRDEYIYNINLGIVIFIYTVLFLKSFLYDISFEFDYLKTILYSIFLFIILNIKWVIQKAIKKTFFSEKLFSVLTLIIIYYTIYYYFK